MNDIGPVSTLSISRRVNSVEYPVDNLVGAR